MFVKLDHVSRGPETTRYLVAHPPPPDSDPESEPYSEPDEGDEAHDDEEPDEEPTQGAGSDDEQTSSVFCNLRDWTREMK